MPSRPAAICGLLAPLTFLVGWLAGGLAQPDTYSFVEDDISDLGALTAESAWLYNQVGANLTGLLMIGFGVGLWGALSPSRAGRAGAGVLVVFGAGEFLDGLFRVDCRSIDPGCDPKASWHAQAHGAETGVTILSFVVAPFVLAWAFRRLPAWRSFWLPTLGVGVASIASLAALSVVGAGLGVRVATTIWFAWIAVLAYRLLHRPREPDVATQTAYAVPSARRRS